VEVPGADTHAPNATEEGAKVFDPVDRKYYEALDELRKVAGDDYANRVDAEFKRDEFERERKR
jgi:hypothetical protein